jgi:hypothetical protein
MKPKTSKAQLEVWEWKERLSEKLGELPAGERIAYVEKMTSRTIEELRKKRGEHLRGQLIHNA